MRGEKSGTTHHGFSGKDFEKGLAGLINAHLRDILDQRYNLLELARILSPFRDPIFRKT